MKCLAQDEMIIHGQCIIIQVQTYSFFFNTYKPHLVKKKHLNGSLLHTSQRKTKKLLKPSWEETHMTGYHTPPQSKYMGFHSLAKCCLCSRLFEVFGSALFLLDIFKFRGTENWGIFPWEFFCSTISTFLVIFLRSSQQNFQNLS